MGRPERRRRQLSQGVGGKASGVNKKREEDEEGVRKSGILPRTRKKKKMKPSKPFLPFPLPIHVGTDICRVSRIASLLAHPTRGRRFVDRVLSPEERSLPRVRRALGEGYHGEGPWGGPEAAEFMAGRFVNLLPIFLPFFFFFFCKHRLGGHDGR